MMQIPTLGKSNSCSRDLVVNILTNNVYYGKIYVEQIIGQAIYNYTNEVLNEKRSKKEADFFTMVRCDFCNAKLVYQKAGFIPRFKATTYHCDKHIGAPLISIENLMQVVL